METKIDRRLRLVVPVERDGSTWGYVHSTPISREVFEANFLPISKAFASLYNEGLGFTAGPRVAALLIRKAAEDSGLWDRVALGLPDVKNGLFAEIRRLTNLVHQGEGGWRITSYQEAVDKGLLDGDEVSEVENAIAFFTLASSMHKKADLRAILDGASRLWDARVESSNCSEFMSSLKTSTAVESSGEKTKPEASFQLR